MDFTLKQLRYFVALAETRSFRRAAEVVHVTQPALSVQIKQLEAKLGAKLVERLPRDVRLTRAGLLTLDRARALLTDVSDLDRSVRLQNGLGGQLLLGVIPTIAPYLLPIALVKIRNHASDLQVRVRESQTADLMLALQQGQVDAAVVSLPVDQTGLASKVLFEDRFLLAGSSPDMSELIPKGKNPTPADIPTDKLLLLGEGHCLADQAVDICGMGSRGQMDLGASSLRTLAGLVAEGFGFTFLPEIALRSEAGNRQLCLRRFAAKEPGRNIVLVRRAGDDSDVWFEELASILKGAGADLIDFARKQVPPPAIAEVKH